jgi:hypothetical protein
MGVRASEMFKVYGPSLAVSKRQFVAVFGTERELLARVDLRRSGAAPAGAAASRTG